MVHERKYLSLSSLFFTFIIFNTFVYRNAISAPQLVTPDAALIRVVKISCAMSTVGIRVAEQFITEFLVLGLYNG